MKILKDAGFSVIISSTSFFDLTPAWSAKSQYDFLSAICFFSLKFFNVSVCGLVFGISITVVYPPCAAAILPEAQSSLYVRPGSLKWTCGSISPGITYFSFKSIILSLVKSDLLKSFVILAIFPSSIIMFFICLSEHLQFLSIKLFILSTYSNSYLVINSILNICLIRALW